MDRMRSLGFMLPLLLLMGTCTDAASARISTLVVFGDSISDTVARDGEALSALWANGSHVEAGGINWVTKVKQNTKIQVLNFAVGGSSVCGGWDYPDATLSFMDQVDQFIAGQKSNPIVGKAAAVVMLGSNDWLFFLAKNQANVSGVTPEATAAVVQSSRACLLAGMAKLDAVPALKDSVVYVATLEALEHIPALSDILPADKLQFIAQQVDATNNAFRAVAAAMNSFSKFFKVKVAEETAAMRKAFAHPPAPITNVGVCLSMDASGQPVMCKDVYSYAFFDDVHYTSTWQKKVLGQLFVKLLRADKLVK